MDYVAWLYLQDFEVAYLGKLGLYVALSYFGLAVNVYDSILSPIFLEIEPYVDVLVQHTALTNLILSCRGSISKFFIDDLEDFLVPT